jgi:hypothetical protein
LRYRTLNEETLIKFRTTSVDRNDSEDNVGNITTTTTTTKTTTTIIIIITSYPVQASEGCTFRNIIL